MQVSLSYVACLIMYKAPPLTVFTLVKKKLQKDAKID